MTSYLRAVTTRNADPSPTGLLRTPIGLDRLGTRLSVPEAATTLDEHLNRFGSRLLLGRELIELLDEVALAGRGGAGFPAATKWRAVADAPGRAIVVGNGAEGEPLSGKDTVLLQTQPHLVLDGLVSAAETLDADEAVIWLHDSDLHSRRAVECALAERQAAALDSVRIRIAVGPEHYLTGESSAVIRALSGGPAKPEYRDRPSAVQGVHGRPTLLHNVETFARVALVARLGLAAPHTTLLTVVPPNGRMVIEVRADSRIGDVLPSLSFPSAIPTAAVLIGGYGGTWLPWATAAEVRANETDARKAGASLGAGIIALLPATACGIAETAAVAAYLASSGARRCGPCLFGLPAIATALANLSRSRIRKSELRHLERILHDTNGRGACHHPDGAVRLVRSAFTVFADDIKSHAEGDGCTGHGNTHVLPIPQDHH